MNARQLLDVFEQMIHPRLLVVGDLVLDRYTWGDADRISQEAPIVVLQADQRQSLLGGAANVGNLASHLGACVDCVGVVGNDEAGSSVRTLLGDSGIHASLVLTDSLRPTTTKERFVGRASGRHPNQILRVDHEVRQPLNHDLETELVRGLEQSIAAQGAVLLSDYGKGVCTPKIIRTVIETAGKQSVPVLVDPARGVSFETYRGATLLKPNRSEAELATGVRIANADDALEAGEQLCHNLDLQWVVITLDRDGMVLVSRDGSGSVVPTAARSVYDITGAGDMVLAMLGACFASGASPLESVQLANVAAGLEVERLGVAVIRRDEIRTQLAVGRDLGATKMVSCDEAARIATELRCHGRTIVFTNGCYDLLHVGHLRNLTEAAAQGDVLVVGVNSDASVRQLKGENRPIINEVDRATMLAALECVDYVVVFGEETPHHLLHSIRPDVLVKGGTYSVDEVVGHEVVKAYGGKVHVTGIVDGVSTSNILQTAYGRAA